jgi:Domain of unknown function (DUF4258)
MTYNIYGSMSEPGRPKPGSKAAPVKARSSAEIVRLDRRLVPAVQPENLSPDDAIRVVRALAVNTANIVILEHGKGRSRQRRITRRQIELCVQKGTVQEGPFLNSRGNWQLNLRRHAAGEEITVVVAIEWFTKVLVISAF